MGTTTSRFGLHKPDDADLAANFPAGLRSDLDVIDSVLGFTPCTSGARPTSPFPGQAILETDTGRTYVRSGSAWLLVGNIQTGVVPANVTITNSSSATDFLVTEVVSGAAYLLDGYVIYQSTTAADIVFSLSGVSSSVGWWSGFGVSSNAGDGLAVQTMSGAALRPSSGHLAGGNNDTSTTSALAAPFRGYLVANSAAMSFRFRQNAATAGANTTILAGSWIRLQRVS